MGADVHMYVEYNSKERLPHANPVLNSWRGFGGRINPGRDYWMFALLADVRGSGALIEPRGLPENLGWQSQSDNRLYISDTNGDDEGNCTLAQAQSYALHGSTIINDNEGKPTWVTHPDWHSHSWLTVDEFQQVLEAYERKTKHKAGLEYRALLAAMRAIEDEGKNDVRLVFWFDN